ncbi:MAG TPA: maleylpyruvate isomerase family mycothiol-dependent enzyme [Streptosporangiaceae bacterium]
MSQPAGAHAVEQNLGRIEAAQDRLAGTAAALSDQQAGEPSLLPGWTRGHVLTHIARNADGLRNLLIWAQTGVETPQYASRDERDAQIEAGAGRTAAELAADLASSAEAFLAQARDLSSDAWDVPVQAMRGPAHPAWFTLHRRLTEVEVHHVDLAAGYAPPDWPAWFVTDLLYQVTGGIAEHADAPAVTVTDSASGRQYWLRQDARSDREITGPGPELLAWLLGRSGGSALVADPQGPLPDIPPF